MNRLEEEGRDAVLIPGEPSLEGLGVAELHEIEARRRRAEAIGILSLPGQREGAHGLAVEGARGGKDEGAPRAGPDQLNGGFDRLGTRRREHATRQSTGRQICEYPGERLGVGGAVRLDHRWLGRFERGAHRFPDLGRVVPEREYAILGVAVEESSPARVDYPRTVGALPCAVHAEQAEESAKSRIETAVSLPRLVLECARNWFMHALSSTCLEGPRHKPTLPSASKRPRSRRRVESARRTSPSGHTASSFPAPLTTVKRTELEGRGSAGTGG